MMYRLETKYRRRSTYFRQNLSLPIFVFAKMLNSWAEIFWRCHLLLLKRDWFSPATASLPPLEQKPKLSEVEKENNIGRPLIKT